jgi:hypothetical protein
LDASLLECDKAWSSLDRDETAVAESAATVLPGVKSIEYLGRGPPYPHVMRQMEDHGLSREERQRAIEEYQKVSSVQAR